MDQKTKIVATIGPATESKAKLKELMRAGVSVFRFNLKHNSHDWHKEKMAIVRDLSIDLGIEIAILADIQGPELRTGVYPNNVETIHLKEKQEVCLSEKPDKNRLWIPFESVKKVRGIPEKGPIFINDGQIELETIKTNETKIIAKVVNGGELGVRKSVSVPGATIDIPSITEKDKKDIDFAINQDVDFLALSFVRDDKDINTLRKIIDNKNGTQHIIAKIETLQAVENIDEIISASDAIMVARGDLGMEIPFEKVPRVQKDLIHKCRIASKPVIVATQMLKSMVSSPIPSRAEVADVANAVFDKSDAVMLSEETTVGQYPIKTVQSMARIVRYNEDHSFVDDLDYTPTDFQEIVIASSIRFSHRKPTNHDVVGGYIVFTESGRSARILSRFRPPLPIYAFTPNSCTAHQMALSSGVIPQRMKLSKNPDTNIKNAIDLLHRKRLLTKGDKLIVTFGQNVGEAGGTNSLTIVDV